MYTQGAGHKLIVAETVSLAQGKIKKKADYCNCPMTTIYFFMKGFHHLLFLFLSGSISNMVAQLYLSFSTAIHDMVMPLERDDIGGTHAVTNWMSFTDIPRGRGPGSILIITHHVQFHPSRGGATTVHSGERCGYSAVVPPGGVGTSHLGGHAPVESTTDRSLCFCS